MIVAGCASAMATPHTVAASVVVAAGDIAWGSSLSLAESHASVDPLDRSDGGAHARRQPVPDGGTRRLPVLVRADVGAPEPNVPLAREPRSPHPRCRRLPPYFGRRAHRRTNATYSFNLDAWHLVSIDSGRGTSRLRSCGGPRPPPRRTSVRTCPAGTIRWSSGTVHGSSATFGPLWRVRPRAGVDVVLNGHEHNYEGSLCSTRVADELRIAASVSSSWGDRRCVPLPPRRWHRAAAAHRRPMGRAEIGPPPRTVCMAIQAARRRRSTGDRIVATTDCASSRRWSPRPGLRHFATVVTPTGSSAACGDYEVCLDGGSDSTIAIDEETVGLGHWACPDQQE